MDGSGTKSSKSQATWDTPLANPRQAGNRFLIAALLLACAWPLPAQATNQDARTVARKVFPSTVLLTMEDSNRQPVAIASGFFVNKGVLATNFHVISGASYGKAKVVGERGTKRIQGVLAVDEAHDLVLLKVDDNDTPFLALRTEEVEIGEPVYVVGNPQGLEGTISSGIVSGVRDFEVGQLIQMTAPISPGSSGGPVVTEDGEVIGVAVATLMGGQNLNFAIPCSVVQELLTNVGDAKPLRNVKGTDTPGILSSFEGTIEEGARAHSFLWESKFVQSPYPSRFSVSVKNDLEVTISDVVVLVVFYDRNREPVEVARIVSRGEIPPGLAKRVTGEVDGSVKRLTTDEKSSFPTYLLEPRRNAVDYRVLDFRIVND